MLLTKQYFELLDDIVNWWNSDSIDFDKAKLDIIINIIKDKQTQLYGVDGQGGLYGNYLDNKFALSDTLTKLRKQSKYQFDFDYEGFRKSRLDNIALKEMYKQQQFILERYADLYAVTMVKRSKMKRAELLKIGVLQKFKDFAIGNFVLESPKNRKNYRVGGTNAYEAVFSQYSQRSLYNKLLNPEEAKTGYDIFKYFVNQSTFLGDWEKVKDSGVLDYFGAISRGN
ncbi:MAG: hypothetical protein LBT99_03360, partial [Bifidobacteriaceae bacterium]|nr:hypothetical protein [Bifidobacteriaceae bacterium]